MSRPITDSGSVSSHPISYDSGYSAYSVSGLENAYTDSNSTTYATVNLTRNSNAETIIFYNFNITGIPSGATIDSVTCKAKCYISSTNSGRIATRQIRLYSGSTAMGSAYTVSNSTNEFTMTAGTWTAEQLTNAKIRLYAKRGTSNTTSNYYFRFYGATLTVNYSINTTAYTITTSSTASGVTIEPASQELLAGESATVYASSISGVTITDNNTDVTSQFVQSQLQPTYTVSQVSGASYGFTLVDGWYTSNNKGISNSAALARVNLNLPVACSITFTYINYAEATYDFGVFSKVDTALSTNYWTSSSNSGDTTTDAGKEERRLNTSAYNTASQQTLTYNSISAGEHFIDVKFGKDAATNSNNDTLQFKLTITPLSTLPAVYAYTISNLNADHTIVVADSGPVSVTGVTLNQNTATIEVGDTLQLTATISPSNATNKSVTWSSNHTNYVTVSNGLVTGVAAGTAVITVTTTDGNYTASCTVTVNSVVYVQYKLATSLEGGKTYLISNTNSGSGYVLTNESGGSRILKGAAVTVSNDKLSIKQNYVSKSSFTYTLETTGVEDTGFLVNNGNYLYTDSSAGLRMMSTAPSAQKHWHYVNDQNKLWQFKDSNDNTNGYENTSSEYKYYLEWDSSGNFTDNHLTSPSIADSTLPAIYLWVEDDGSSDQTIYLKVSGSWVACSKVYKKVSGSWVEQSDLTNVFDSNTIYIKT